MNKSNTNQTKRRKRERLSEDEKIRFEEWAKSFDTKQEAYEELNINPKTFDKLLDKSAASPETIAKVRLKLGVSTTIEPQTEPAGLSEKANAKLRKKLYGDTAAK